MHTLTGVLNRPIAITRKKAHAATYGWIALAIMIIAGSTNSSFGKQLEETFSPLSMIFLSEMSLLFFATFSFGIIPLFKKIKNIRRSLILPLVTAGTVNGVLGPVFWFTGLGHTSAVNAELFGMTEMLFLMVFGVIFVHQSLKRIHSIGGSIILLGLLTVTLRGFSSGINIQMGDFFIILACLCYGIGGTIIQMHLRSVPPQVIIVMRSLTALTFFFLMSPFLSHSFMFELQGFPSQLIPALLSYGFISRFLLVFCFYEAIEHLPVHTVSLLTTLTVAGAALFAHVYLGEEIAWYQIAGAALIILGATVVQWSSLHQLEMRVVHYLKAHRR